MSRIIIGIHGLGNKPEKQLLENWWRMSMMEGLANIHSDQELPEFELVYWADILNDKPLDLSVTDPRDPYYLNDKYVPFDKNFIRKKSQIRQKVLRYLEIKLDRYFLNEDLSSNYSFFSNLVISRYFREVEIYFNNDCHDERSELCLARDTIKRRLINTLLKHQDKEIILLAHSMGSIVAYDVLAYSIPEFKIHTFITIGSPLGLPFIISKIAGNEKFKLSGDKKLKAPPGIHHRWYNFADPNDNIAFDKSLRDDYHPNALGIQAKDVLVENNYVIRGKSNPHKSFGYLRARKFSRILNHLITPEPKRTIKFYFKRILKFIKLPG